MKHLIPISLNTIFFHCIITIMKGKEGLEIMRKASRKFGRFWKWYGRFSFAVSMIFMVLVSLWLFRSAFSSFHGRGGLSLVLPSVSGTFSTKPGLVLIPMWLWLLAIVIIAIPHEFSHGVVAMAEGMRVKSASSIVTGLAMLFLLAGPLKAGGKLTLKDAGGMTSVP